MRAVLTGLKWSFGALAALLVIVAAWLYFAPPALIRVGAGYAAKIVCSNVFLAGREAEEVLRVDVQAPGHPLLRLMRVRVDVSAGTVEASLLGVFARRVAQDRAGLGCAVLPDDGAWPPPLELLRETTDASLAAWPVVDDVQAAPDPTINAILDNPAMAGPGMRAIVVVQDGRIVGERYGVGFSAETPLLGWSMTKTVTAAIIGALVKAGKIDLDWQGLVPAWAGDDRNKIRIRDLMAMSSGLAFNESYGDVSDVTRMLYLSPDMAAFAADQALTGEIGKTFAYSSGTTLILSRVWQDALGSPQAALAWPRKALFDPLGMSSAIFETDAAGTLVGSSYLYATARDWARFGQFLLQDGVWNGQAILPPGYVKWMREPAPASDSGYGSGHVWLRGPVGDIDEAALGIPDDVFWLIGHDGQSMAILPSRKLVVVRLGLTPSWEGYRPQRLVGALASAMENPR